MALTSGAAAILQALFEKESLPTPDCDGCQEHLAAFVDAELAGFDLEPGFSALRAHLAACTNCQEAYEELRELLGLEREGALDAPPMPGYFDFGYLPTRSAAPSSRETAPGGAWRWDALGRLIIQFSADLLRSLRAPGLQPGYLKGTDFASAEYSMSDPAEGVEVRVRVAPLQHDPRLYDVAVDIEIARRGGWPNLRGILVTLRYDAAEPRITRETDAFGRVVFEGISAEALSDLGFEIAVP